MNVADEALTRAAAVNPKFVASFFFSYECEGATHCRRREYEKAIAAYTKALGLRPGHAPSLVARGWCHLFAAQHHQALQDAAAALHAASLASAVCAKAHHLQGEALFAEGEFEHAVVAFHRAARLRPEMSSFRLGIQKCTAAVIRCFGASGEGNAPPPRASSAASLPASDPRGSSGEIPEMARSRSPRPARPAGPRGGGADGRAAISYRHRRSGRRRSADASSLSQDAHFLQQLQRDEGMRELVGASVDRALEFLSARRDYWRHQLPRPPPSQCKSSRREPAKRSPSTPLRRARPPSAPSQEGARRATNGSASVPATPRTPQPPSSAQPTSVRQRSCSQAADSGSGTEASRSRYLDHTRFVVQVHCDVRAAVATRSAEALLTVCQNFWLRIPSLDVVDKLHHVADVLVSMGAAWYQLGEPREAVTYFHTAQEISQQIHYQPAFQRSHVALATALASLGEFARAAASYKACMEFVQGPALHRVQVSLGHCQLEMGQPSDAIANARVALQSKDERVLMRAHLLMGECLMQMGSPGSTAQHEFVEYARIAREQHDVQAESHGLHMSNRARNLIAAGHVSGDSFCFGAAINQSDGVGSRNMHGSCTSEVKHGNDLHSDGNNTDDDEYLDEWEEG
mmetsp:Transcript_14714/g.28292  ORF Transcript_14714/g.28292 Transcript_14714/m.28292 type:complete len:630 (-) Transcript_14714:228-2117(-)|eukprot:CAMPEP_0114262326 /NCGR_PEP_ID=MMETSP0058-20121206/21734_1 /TAXON_ID=36894 /ORGANISM="Pyramimonas parkeae, CCMP726" /LENGTH=629 /DNA_ID=CAMNT_0001378167 /DNA_START=200 /DNA_END=2089 /DNA_ORIENTATION=-